MRSHKHTVHLHTSEGKEHVELKYITTELFSHLPLTVCITIKERQKTVITDCDFGLDS